MPLTINLNRKDWTNFIYFKEIALNENNKFTLEFYQTDQIYKVHFSPKKDYFITSMNCDLNLEQDIKNDGVLDEVKEPSEKSRLLLEKGPTYQNDIKTLYLWWGLPETTLEKVSFGFSLSAANIKRFSWLYKFCDIEGKRDCKIYSPYDQFINRSLKFTNRHLTYTVGMKKRYRGKRLLCPCSIQFSFLSISWGSDNINKN